MQTNIRITSLSMNEKPRSDHRGTVLAHFDADVGGIVMRGCMLIEKPSGEITCLPPKLIEESTSRRAVTISDEALRREVATVALAAFQALGGIAGRLIANPDVEPVQPPPRALRWPSSAELSDRLQATAERS